MKNLTKGKLFLCGLAAGVTILSSVSDTRATPYATSITNDGANISFRLNQAADKVRIISNGGATVSDIGARPVGLTVTNLAITGTFQIEVTRSNGPGWLGGAALQISSDTTPTVRFPSPRGVAVNTDPASPYFGRIYVANSVGGNVAITGRTNLGDGIFVLNSDYTDTFLQGTNARTGGITKFVQSFNDQSTPWHIEVGQDWNLYIGDHNTNSGNMYVTDPDVATNATATNILMGFGSPDLTGNGTNLHGRISSSIIATGSLANANLTLFALDGDNEPGGTVNRLRRWDVGAGPLPVALATTNLNNKALLEIQNVTVDMERGPDGKFYLVQLRSSGGEAGLFVIDPQVDNNDDFLTGTPDGVPDVVYDSYSDSTVNLGQTADLLLNTQAVKVSPDGNYLALVRDDSKVWIIPLVSGIPNLAARRLVNTGSTTSGRDVSFDRAGNLYVATSGHSAVRVFSPGYPSVATTGSDGTFNVTRAVPDNSVEVVASNPNASEPANPGTFTFTRSGSTAAAITVPYTIAGTAINGTDYVTNTLSVTFPVGVDTTSMDITPINDNLGEPVETVILTLNAPTNIAYLLGTSTTATIQISDDGDLPAVSVATRGLGSYELLPGRPAKFTFSILNVFSSDITIHYTMSGTAVSGTDFVAPSGSVTLPSGLTTTNIFITPIDNAVASGNKTIVVNVAADPGYVVGAGASATNILRDDELPAGTGLLFSDDFDTNSLPAWTVKMTNPTNDATFNYDYSADGVPPAPHSVGGTTTGLRLRAHTAGPGPGLSGVASGVSVSPTGKSFTGDYRVRFDLWMNFNGPMPGGGTGSSEYFTTGIGVSETRTNVTGGIANGNPGSSVVFAVDSDGGFAEGTGDFIVYSNTTSIAASGTNVYPAGARDNFNAYYAEFGEIPAPAAQVALGLPAPFDQRGKSEVGSLAGATWHDVVITRQGTNVLWDIDGLRIANTPYTAAFQGNNISLGFQDINNSLSGFPQMNFGLVDNLRVDSLTVTPPTITAITIINSGTQVQVDFSAGAGDAPAAFTLQNSSVVTGTYADTAATVIPTGTGTFRAVVTLSGSQNFYRIKR